MVFLLSTTGFSYEGFRLGTYAAHITPADTPSGFPPRIAPLLVGYWEVTYSADGRLSSTNDGRFAFEGRYAATETQYAEYNETGPLACPGAGVYIWEFDGRTMTFKKIADECTGRVMLEDRHAKGSSAFEHGNRQRGSVRFRAHSYGLSEAR